MQVMSSKAKGIDRLTGRARRSVTTKHHLHQCHTQPDVKVDSAISPQPVTNDICAVNVGNYVVFLHCALMYKFPWFSMKLHFEAVAVN